MSVGYEAQKGDYSIGANGNVSFDSNTASYGRHQLDLGNRVRLGSDGMPYVVDANGQPVGALGGISTSNNGASVRPVDNNGNVINGEWQAQRDAANSQYTSLNGQTPGVTVNQQGYSAGAYGPSDISQANGFGTQFGANSSNAAQAGDYTGSNGSLASAAMAAQSGNNDAYQQAALRQNYAVMNGAPSLGYQQGVSSLAQGMSAQQAAAGSAMGGALGQAAALRQNAQSSAGMYATGMAQNNAIQAQAQDAARQQYAAQLSAMRTSGQQGINAQQAIAGTYSQNAQDQAAFTQNQNQLHDQASLYGQGLAAQMKASNYGQQQAELNAKQGASHAKQSFEAEQDKNVGQVVGAGIGGIASMAGAGSDVRTKEPVSLADAAEMRYWR